MDHLPGRRSFLRSSLAAATVAAAVLPGWSRSVLAADCGVAGFANVNHPILTNIMLQGGPDFRHAFPPPYSDVASTVGGTYWTARATSHALDTRLSSNELQQRWENDFFHVADGNTEFGILRKCDWLHDLWLQGKVAFTCGLLNDSSRDHELAIRAMEMGNRTAGKLQFGNGWGGRLANAAGGNVVALTTSPRRFAFGPDPALPLDLLKVDKRNLVPATDTRNISLPNLPDYNPDWFNTRDYLVRALKQYYPERRKTIPAKSVFRQFADHEAKLRNFGELIDCRLAGVQVPDGLSQLFLSPEEGGVRYDLALQMRNLYDALASNDLLDMRVASLEFPGWDTHKLQRTEMEPNLTQLFGLGGGLHRLFESLPANARSNLVVVIAGEFGRQLKSNGGGGTDHGDGSTAIIIGDSVRGGVFGTMFPEEEIARVGEDSADIQGVNAIDHVFGAICNRVAPGSKAQVFPNGAGAPVEAGVDFSTLFG